MTHPVPTNGEEEKEEIILDGHKLCSYCKKSFDAGFIG